LALDIAARSQRLHWHARRNGSRSFPASRREGLLLLELEVGDYYRSRIGDLWRHKK